MPDYDPNMGSFSLLRTDFRGAGPGPSAPGAPARQRRVTVYPARTETGNPPPFSTRRCRVGGHTNYTRAEDAAASFVDMQSKGLGGANTLSPFPLPPLLNTPPPDTFDKWRQEGYLSPPQDQARCGACYVFAAVGQLADRIAIATKGRAKLDLSTQFVLSCLQSKYEYGCGGTLDVPPIYAALMPGGLLGGTYRHYLFPYSGQQWDPKPNKDPKGPCYYVPDAPECDTDDDTTGRRALELPAHCLPPPPSAGMACTGTVPCNIAYIRRWYSNEPKFSFAKIFHLSENTNAKLLYPGQAVMEHHELSVPAPMSPMQFKRNVQRIKESIYLYGPVTAVIPIYSDFGTKFKPGTVHWNDANYVYEVDKTPSNRITGFHHVLLVGWSRDRKGGYWIIKNSWGVWWNYDGYFNARIGDPLLLAESNCHSGLPYNPITGKEMAAFDHEAANGADAPSRAWGAPLIIFVIVIILAALILVRGIKRGDSPAGLVEATGKPPEQAR